MINQQQVFQKLNEKLNIPNENRNINNNLNDNIKNNINQNSEDNNLSYLNETSPYIEAEMFTNVNEIQDDLNIVDELETIHLGKQIRTNYTNEQVSENELRYGISVQLNDLMNDIISKMPITKRNKIAFYFVENLIKRRLILEINFPYLMINTLLKVLETMQIMRIFIKMSY